ISSSGISGAAGGLMGGPIGGMLQNQSKQFVETLKKSVREIRLTVSWQDGKQKRDVSASQMIVILPETVGKAGQTPGVQPLPNQLNPQGGPINLPGAPKPPSSDPGQSP